MWKIQSKKLRAKKIDYSKVATYKNRNMFSTHVRFSIILFVNLELLQKKVNKPRTKN
jgi:hypothetical protein